MGLVVFVVWCFVTACFDDWAWCGALDIPSLAGSQATDDTIHELGERKRFDMWKPKEGVVDTLLTAGYRAVIHSLIYLCLEFPKLTKFIHASMSTFCPPRLFPTFVQCNHLAV